MQSNLRHDRLRRVLADRGGVAAARSCGCGCNGQGPVGSIISDGVQMQGGTGYDDGRRPDAHAFRSAPNRSNGVPAEPDNMTLPPAGESEPLPPQTSQSGTSPASQMASLSGSPAVHGAPALQPGAAAGFRA